MIGYYAYVTTYWIFEAGSEGAAPQKLRAFILKVPKSCVMQGIKYKELSNQNNVAMYICMYYMEGASRNDA